MRFAFYGRMSTEDYQDPVTSRQWHWTNATELIVGKGTVVAEFFDVGFTGFTRRPAWSRRPRAAALLEAVADAGRGFGAVVIGVYERAFYGKQFTQIAAVLRAYGVQLWMPEVDGPVDFDDPHHQALMRRLGMKAKQEVWRAQTRVIAAMGEQAREQGRFLGGRPPYRYRLADAGPQLRTVAAILANPRYTAVRCDTASTPTTIPTTPRTRSVNGAKDVMRWNPPDRWVISKEPAHTALVSEADFIAVQKVHVVPTPPDGTTREYVLGGMIRCGPCGRKMDSHRVNGWPGYRCRHGHNNSKQPDLDRTKTLYLREDRALAQLAELVASPCASTLAEVEAMLRSGELVVIAEPGSHPARSHRRSSLNAQNIISQALATPVRTSVSPKLVACVPSVPSIRANLTDTINQRPS